MDLISILAVGVVTWLVLSFVSKFLEARRDILAQMQEQKLEDNPLVYIDEVRSGDSLVFLVFNAVTNKFVCQGTTVQELEEGVRRVFSNKEIVNLLVDEKTIRPMFIK